MASESLQRRRNGGAGVTGALAPASDSPGVLWASQGRSLMNTVSQLYHLGWLGSRVVSVLDSGAEGPGFKSQPRRGRVTVLGKLFTPIVPLFTKQQNW